MSAGDPIGREARAGKPNDSDAHRAEEDAGLQDDDHES